MTHLPMLLAFAAVAGQMVADGYRYVLRRVILAELRRGR